MKRKLNGRTYVPGYGSLSVTVPGAVDGWYALHDKFGKLPMADLLAPAIAYAQDGFPVSQFICRAVGGEHGRPRLLPRCGGVRERAEDLSHRRRAAGRGPDVQEPRPCAAPIRRWRQGGRDAFYKGPIAKTMDAYFRRIGGRPAALEDFAAHRGEWVEPISVNYRGYDVYEMPPNSQGAAALEMLKILEGYDLKKPWGRALPIRCIS